MALGCSDDGQRARKRLHHGISACMWESISSVKGYFDVERWLTAVFTRAPVKWMLLTHPLSISFSSELKTLINFIHWPQEALKTLPSASGTSAKLQYFKVTKGKWAWSWSLPFLPLPVLKGRGRTEKGKWKSKEMDFGLVSDGQHP